MTTARAHVFISGRVQGVNFRHYTRQQALKTGVRGWIRNLWDGRVEAVFEGDEDKVQRMVDWCHSGPPAAQVDGVEVAWQSPAGNVEGFEIRMTASGR